MRGAGDQSFVDPEESVTGLRELRRSQAYLQRLKSKAEEAYGDKIPAERRELISKYARGDIEPEKLPGLEAPKKPFEIKELAPLAKQFMWSSLPGLAEQMQTMQSGAVDVPQEHLSVAKEQTEIMRDIRTNTSRDGNIPQHHTLAPNPVVR